MKRQKLGLEYSVLSWFIANHNQLQQQKLKALTTEMKEHIS